MMEKSFISRYLDLYCHIPYYLGYNNDRLFVKRSSANTNKYKFHSFPIATAEHSNFKDISFFDGK